MACIACGLALNADNRGRVDVDPNGGIECQGSGGGLTNAVGSGLRIKRDASPGNSVELTNEGLYIPRKSSFKAVQNTYVGGAISNPGVGSGGTSVSSPIVSTVIDNSGGTSPMSVVYEGHLHLASGVDPTSSAPRWFELYVQDNGGGWNAACACIIPTDAFLMPWHTGPFVTTVAAGSSHQFDARAVFYTGDYPGYRVTITAWGDYSD